MRGPKDSDIQSTVAVGALPTTAATHFEARTVAGERQGPPGGKALLRLMTFIAERGFDIAPAPSANQVEPARMAAVYAGVAQELRGWAGPHDLAPAAAAPGAAPAAALPSWRPLGPVVMHNGQTYGSGRIDVSGRVAAIAVDPSNRNHLLVGAAGGGVWESRD